MNEQKRLLATPPRPGISTLPVHGSRAPRPDHDQFRADLTLSISIVSSATYIQLKGVAHRKNTVGQSGLPISGSRFPAGSRHESPALENRAIRHNPVKPKISLDGIAFRERPWAFRCANKSGLAGTRPSHEPLPIERASRTPAADEQNQTMPAVVDPGLGIWKIEHMQFPKPARSLLSQRTLSHFKSLLSLVLACLFGLPALAQLPSGWASADVGAPALPGAAAQWLNGDLTVSGGGLELCNNSQFHFAWRAFNGDGAVVVKVRGVTGGDFLSEAGLMVRSDLSASSPQAALMVRTNTSVWFRARGSTSTACNSQGVPPRNSFVWLKLERSGNTFSGAYSLDGETWTVVGAQTVAMSTRALAGLAACSYSEAVTCTGRFSDFRVESPALGVNREGWTGLNPGAGDTLAALTNTTWNPNWPNDPDPLMNTFFPSWETEINSGLTQYGQRLRAFVVPPVDGPYVFTIASHNTSELRLSPDESPDKAAAIARVNTATAPREWQKEPNQTSDAVQLQGGKRYYLESLMQHSTGVDHLAVRWQLPAGYYQEPLPAVSSGFPQLIPFTGDAAHLPGIYFQPTNTSVAEGGTARLWLLVTNPAVVEYQWQLNGTNLPTASARDSVLTLSNVTVGLRSNDLFTCIVSNAIGTVTSAVATVTVIADTNSPVLLRATYRSPTEVRLVFSEPIDETSATQIAHYQLNGGASVLQATLLADQVTVDLLTTVLTQGVFYDLSVSGIRDQSFNGNLIRPTLATFFSSHFTPAAIGSPAPPGSITGTPDDGIDLAGGGNDIGGNADQFEFAYQLRIGDFDVKVRLQSLSQTDAYAKAGLIAREDLNPNTRFAATLATPTIAGAFFSARSFVGARATTVGLMQVNYPEMWLRLQRQGDVFTGYGSYDGETWQQLGTLTMSLTNTLHVGVGVASHQPAVTALAQFRQFSDVTNAVVGRVPPPPEPLGPSSRRTGLALTEIMYHPADRTDGRNLEFIEILNTQPFFEDISGYRISGDVEYTFPAGTILASGAYAVVAAAPADIGAAYGLTAVFGPYENRLSNSGGTVRLSDRFGAVLLEVQYKTESPWPIAADGAGHSLVLIRPSYGEKDARAWAASGQKGGSPGATDYTGKDPASGVVINEFLAHTDPPVLDAIELFNRNLSEVDLSGCFLSDNPNLNKFKIPNGTRIPARGFLVFNENQLGFRLDAAGESIYLVNAANTQVLDAIRFGGQANGVSSGRYPDGEEPVVELVSPSLGSKNTLPLTRDIVINEIFYNPISDDQRDEFVELYNKGAEAVSLAGWRFTEGITFTFPPGTRIPAGAYLVLAKDATRLRAKYANLNPGNLVGDYGGALSNQGERLTLCMPDQVVSTNASGVVQTNTIYIVADQVDYGTGGRWGQWSDGGGSSLELINPHADNRLAPNWADSDESTKAPWTTVEHTGVLDHGHSSYPADQLHVILQGAGECLVDNVEVFRTGSTNRMRNGSFDTGTANWFFQGTHRLSSFTESGLSGGALHLRASARGDTGANRTRALLFSALRSGETATLRAQVRWLKGNPEILLRLKGNWLEAPGRLNLPANLGTPGARNSRFQQYLGPAITEVAHAPVLPAMDEPITVTARIADPEGVGEVLLVYRNDTSSGQSITLPMTDDGLGADALAGDGVFSARIPAQGAKVMLAFHIQARDNSVAQASSRFPNNAPGRECLVQTGESLLAGSFGTYRLWVTRSNTLHWASRERNSNDPLDATFVYGNSRVIYNMRTLYSGSPFHTGSYSSPVGSACDYVLQFPDDETVLGANDFVIATLGNLNNDSTAQREQAAFWMLREMGAPSLHRRYIFMFVNGARRGTVMEDAQQPNGDVIDQYFPDDPDGNLHKIEDWFEFDNAGSSFSHVDATLDNFLTTGGQKKLARYRWCWRPRAVQGSYSDFTNLFQLVDTLQLPQPEPYTSSVESFVDVENWMRVFALERIVGNWDSFSYNRGKNMYAYKPPNGRWTMMAWDVDFVLGTGDGPTSGLFGGQDWPTALMKYHPPFARAYWRAFYDAVNGPMVPTRFSAQVEAKYAGLLANGVTVTAPSVITTYVSQRRNYLQNQLAAVAATFSVNNPAQSGNLAMFSGRAPVQIRTILFNGVPYPVTWTSVTEWRATVPLQSGLNTFLVTGTDTFGMPVPGASRQVSVNYNLPLPSPVGQIAINEIMVNTVVPGAEFVELYNNSPSTAFELSDWQFNGLSYRFPVGTVLAPNSYLVLAANRTQFGLAYGIDAPVFDVFAGRLQPQGETLTLFTAGTNRETVAKVRYEGGAPWPASPGKSYQLRDPRLDNWRAGNWGTAQPDKPQWQYFTTTGTASSSTLYMYLESSGDMYLDDLRLVAGSQPDIGPNYIANGGFETVFPGPWTVSANHAGSYVTTKWKRSGESSLYLSASSGGSTQSSSIWQTLSPALTSGATYTLSFWYLPGSAKTPFTVRLSGSGVSGTVAISPVTGAARGADPGAANAERRSLPAFPPLWINELQAENLTGITNNSGQRAPWVELHNPTLSPVSLDGLYLANNYTNLMQWAFPSNAVIAPGDFELVFTDGQTNRTTTNELHANFVLQAGAGSLALSRIHEGEPQVLDYVNYQNVRPDRSFGSFPDGQAFERQEFFYVTPAGTNNPNMAPIDVKINEWMADNASTLADPVDGNFEDWFEIYNPGNSPADLGGYYLTDSADNKTQFQVPSNGHYIVPPGGYLLVWADGEANQNSTNVAQLHTNFRLDKAGESIGLFAPDGRTIDLVSFGPQQTDRSEGRYPDGSAAIGLLPRPTPGAANAGGNTAPVLDSVPDAFVYVGQRMNLQIQAADADEPVQALTFSIDPGAPDNASMDPVTGLFTWSPSSVPATNLVTVRVTDDGEPSLSSQRSFQVVVVPLPQLHSQITPAGTLRLSLQTVSGQTYELLFTDDFLLGTWREAIPAFSGTGAVVELELPWTDAATTFYRMLVSR